MSALFDSLGINPTLLLAQAVNFLLVFWLLHRFVFKKVLKFLEERKQRIEKGVRLTQRAELEMQRIGEARTRALGKAREEAAAMLLAAKAEGSKAERQAAEKAQQRSQELLAKAQGEADRKKQDALKQAQGEMKRSAFMLAEKVLARSLTEEDEKRMGEELAKELKSYG